MNETLLRTLPTEQVIQQSSETSDETGWQSPGYTIVDTALEVTAYTLADR